MSKTHVWTLFLLLLIGIIKAPMAKAASDCEEFFQDGQEQAYDVTCMELPDTTSGGEPDAKTRTFSMTAFAKDASHIIVTYRVVAGIRTYISYSDKVSGAVQRFLGNDHGEVKSGRSLSQIDVAETTARLNGSDNKCLIFQKLGRREYSGYKKVNLGMICTQRDISLAYDALEKLLLPS